MAIRLQLRRGTASSWTSANPTLAQGELGYETDTGKFKIGNGSSTWTALTYFGNLSGDFVGTTDTQTLSKKTLLAPQEITTVSATAATGTINFDALTQGVLYYTTNASANFTLNFRGNSGTTLSSLMDVGDSISLVFLCTNGATPYYMTTFQIDGSTITPEWAGGSAPSAGNASSIDAYSFTIIKTAATPTYTVLAGQTMFA